MATGTVKKKATPSSIRRRKAQHRIRKKIKTKLEKKKPNWKEAIVKVYKGDRKNSSTSDSPFPRKRSREDNGEGSEHIDDDAEVQSDIDEERQERLNEINPLETQLFLKHLPLDTSEEEMKEFFTSHFGKIRKVLLVRNKISKSLTGTGFVHCGSVEMANKIFENAQQCAREVSASNRSDLKEKTEGLSHHQAKRMMHKLRTDTFTTRDPFLTIRHSKFTVHRVFSRTESQEVIGAMQKKKKRTKVAADDPRNLYLLQEGLILPDTRAAKDLHPRYLQMIQDDYEARKNQLRNSNYFVSKYRLSVRNLPRNLSEVELRKLFANHARKYLKKHEEDMEKEKWGKYGPIKNIKLLVNSDGVSKGYGFVEFINHNVALNVLRSLNNNPNIFGDSRRLLVSFSIENINAVQKLQRIKELKRHSPQES